MNDRYLRFYRESGLAGTIGQSHQRRGIRTIHWTRLFFWIAIGVGLLAACGSNGSVAAADETLDNSAIIDDGSAPVPIDVDALRDSTWTLQFGSGPAGNVVLVDGWPITITFDDETFGGTAACNSYAGTYSIDGSTIRFHQTGINAQGCNPNVEASQVAFVAALRDVDGINLVGDEMALSGIDSELIFGPTERAPVADLFDQLWVLQAISSNDEETAAKGEPATLRIDSDGGFTGTTGCRTFTGRYRILGNSISFFHMASDGNCPSSLSNQDGHVGGVLGDGFTVAIENDTLTAVSAGNQRLLYRATDEGEVSGLPATYAQTDAELLDGIEWIFVGGYSPDGPIADPRSIDSTSSITLTFSDDQYSGNAACNAYGGEAGLDKGLWSFTLGVPQSEEEGCDDKLDEIAAAYLSALPLMRQGGIEYDGQGLVMNDGVETMFMFERAR